MGLWRSGVSLNMPAKSHIHLREAQLFSALAGSPSDGKECESHAADVESLEVICLCWTASEVQQFDVGSQSSVYDRLNRPRQTADITWTAEQGLHSTLLPTLGCHHLPELFHLLLLLFLVLLTHCTRTEATHPSGLCLLIHLKGLLIQPLVMLVNIGWESKLPKIDIRLQKFNALMGMEPIPEIIRGNRPQEKPENACAPSWMDDVQRLKVLGILCVKAVPELSH
mmetsp:Transcript_13241/g.19958  ORF Transcript_13241/g.19958 Transcript_13241/m.19958 type:complete len:225 (-) Transcript_13241:560-1234(-)